MAQFLTATFNTAVTAGSTERPVLGLVRTRNMEYNDTSYELKLNPSSLYRLIIFGRSTSPPKDGFYDAINYDMRTDSGVSVGTNPLAINAVRGNTANNYKWDVIIRTPANLTTTTTNFWLTYFHNPSGNVATTSWQGRVVIHEIGNGMVNPIQAEVYRQACYSYLKFALLNGPPDQNLHRGPSKAYPQNGLVVRGPYPEATGSVNPHVTEYPRYQSDINFSDWHFTVLSQILSTPINI